MPITKFDIYFILSMSLALVILNFTLPAMGFQDPNTNQTDIPEYNITGESFNYVKEPSTSPPQAPSEGTLNHSSTQFDDYAGSIQYELGNDNNGNRTFLVVNPENTTYITDVENNSIDDTHTYTSNGEETTLSANGFTIDLISRDINTGVYEYVITQRPGDNTWYAGIPIIGGIFSSGNQLEAIVAWVGSIIYPWYEVLVDGSLNTGSIVFQNLTYAIDLFQWQIDTYFSIINYPSEAWVTFILTIPGMGLSLEFIKFTYMGIKALPFFG